MPRPPRIDYEGAWHHVMNRGRNREIIFRNDDDLLAFLDELQRVVGRFGVEVHAYSLMPNHYHLLVRSVHGNLSDAMQRLGSDYSRRFNLRHGGDGSVFRGRFKSELVEEARYLKYLIAYIHLNPLRANLVTRIDSDYAWTSHRAYMKRDKAPSWLTRKFFQKVFKTPEKLEAYLLSLHNKGTKWPEEFILSTGWFKRRAGKPSKADNSQSAMKKMSPEKLLNAICRVTGASPERLTESIRGSRGNPERRFAVWAMKNSTFMTHRQIAALLQMTPDQVGKDIQRSRAKIEAFESWVEKWQEAYPGKMSIVRV